MLVSPKMTRTFIWALFILIPLFLHTTKSNEEGVRDALTKFYQKISNGGSRPLDTVLGWNLSSGPCKDHWMGVSCDQQNLSVVGIYLDGLNFSGTFDASILCNVQSIAASLTAISLNNNSLHGENLDEIGNCRQLTRLFIGGNRFSGSIPDSLSRLNNLKDLDMSRNNFTGSLPDWTRVSGLQQFFAQNNHLTGPIPNSNFSNLVVFNVSFNQLSGPIPYWAVFFPISSFLGNPELCGDPLPKKCPLSLKEGVQGRSQGDKPKNDHSNDTILMFSVYFFIGFALFLHIILKLCKKRDETKEEGVDAVNKVASFDDGLYQKPGEDKTGLSKSEISAEIEMVSSESLTVLSSPEVNGLKFDDLLKAPAELLRRGRHGTVYKITCEQGMTLAVKRIRSWGILSNDFKQRMQRLDQVKHPNVLPALAFYCTRHEKLLVYGYQQNGSLFNLLHGTQTDQGLDWSIRLGIADKITQALAFMHQELHQDGIAHGNLKSSNILLNKNMEPCISEYGLLLVNNEFHPSLASSDGWAASPSRTFQADIYGLGVILLELLTGKLVKNSGLDLANWVLSMVREEWTVEVFDKSLIQEGASEESMVNLLQIAVKCINHSPDARPSVNQVALMIGTIKEEEERSSVSEST